MILQPHEKSDEMFKAIKRITDMSFKGVENPPIQILREAYDIGIVFVTVPVCPIPELTSAYAIVTTSNPGEAKIWSIATDPKYRGLRQASGLLQDVTRWARINGIYLLSLTVHVDNPAQMMYYKNGFRVKQVLTNFYFGADGLLMRKEIL